jgi:hypothetical protein
VNGKRERGTRATTFDLIAVSPARTAQTAMLRTKAPKVWTSGAKCSSHAASFDSESVEKEKNVESSRAAHVVER